MEFKEYYQQKLTQFEAYLRSSFPLMDKEVAVLQEAMTYSLMAGGKRLRPILVMTTLEAAGKDPAIGLPFGCAIEYIHTYSLIHDDLPCMDDDDLRRGFPTNHKKFGEDIALLAGDALLTHAFFHASSPVAQQGVPADQILRIIALLSEHAGIRGMISGQVADLKGIPQGTPSETLEYVHRNKTGAMISVSIQIGAILAGVIASDYEHLTKFGHEIGKCFQIQDDILDEIGDQELLGKPIGSDQKNQKLTYPSLYGLATSQKMAQESYEQAIFHLKETALQTDRLIELSQLVVKRSH